jgi:uncharacterized membrane protein YkoI
MRYRHGAMGALLVMVLFGAAPDPASAKSKREMAAQHQARITLTDAISIAQKEIPGGKVFDAELSMLHGNVSYAVEIVKDGVHAVRVDIRDGSVIEVTPKPVPPKEWQQLEAFEQAKVTLVEAISIAQNELPGGVPASADVKLRKGEVMYRVDIEKDGLHVVHVHLQSGRVLKVTRLDD